MRENNCDINVKFIFLYVRKLHENYTHRNFHIKMQDLN